LSLLRKLGCQFGQGYFFSRPLSGDAAGMLLAEPPRWLEPEGRDLEAILNEKGRNKIEADRTAQAQALI
jgi:hypothetical protein